MAMPLVFGLAWGCGGSTPRVADATPSAVAYHGVSDYLPLENDTVLSFETETEGTAERGLLIMQVRRPRPNVVELDIGGKIRRLDLTRDGVKIVEGGWLLKKPLEVGATFTGQNGPVRVKSIHTAIDVPAGHFTDCVETEEVSPAARTLTTFCPLVGITLLDVESMSVSSPERVTARLKAHGPRVDVGSDQVRVVPK
jgi:hypothetical protein